MIEFLKIQGTGNDFIVLEGENNPELWGQKAIELCHRRTGVGGDGLIWIQQLSEAEFAMRMWNPDGSESEMCGNGTRCAGRYIQTKYQIQTPVKLQLLNRTVNLEPVPEGYKVQMGKVFVEENPLELHGYTGYSSNLSNPHFVLEVEDVWAFPLETVGPLIENDSHFPNRTNVHIFQKLSSNSIKMRSWERGAGLTLACGSGASCTAATAYLRYGLEPTINVEVPGGHIIVSVNAEQDLTMSGPAEIAFEGRWP